MARQRLGSAKPARSAERSTRYGKKKKQTRTLREVLDDRLTHHFTLPVRAVRLEPGRFWDWHHRGRAVHGCGGRIDESGAVKFGHDLKEEYRCADIVVIVRERNFCRLAYGLVGLFGAG
jgi:hypothetical protein